MKSEAMMIPVPFHSDTVWATDQDGSVLVAVKPICENLGLDWKSQHRRLNKTSVLAKGVVMMTIPSPGGAQETLCLPLKLIPGWLLGVETKRVKPQIRAKIEQYQEECYEVLWQHFRGSTPEPVPGKRPSTEQVHNGIEASLHPHQLRVLAAVKAYGATDTGLMMSTPGLAAESVKRAIYLLWYLGVVETYWDAGVMRCRVVPADKRPALPMPRIG